MNSIARNWPWTSSLKHRGGGGEMSGWRHHNALVQSYLFLVLQSLFSCGCVRACVRVCVCVCVCMCVCVCTCERKCDFLKFHSSSVPCRRVGSSDVEDYSKTTGATRAALPSATSVCVFRCLLLCCNRDYLLLLPGQAGKPLLFFDFQLPRSLLHLGPEAHGSNTTFTCIQGTKYQVQCPCQTRRYSAEPGSTQEQPWISTVWNISQWMWSQDVSATVSPKWLCARKTSQIIVQWLIWKKKQNFSLFFSLKKKVDQDSESLCVNVWEKVFQHLGALPHKALKPDCCFGMISSTFQNMQLVRGFHRLLKLTITSLDNNLHI